MRLDDASGYTPTAGQLAELEAAACRLIDSLPLAFRDSFRVYDFGFYLHNETQQGGYPEAFQWAVDTVQTLSKYYLLFGKQTDRSGVYMRFWVELKLPDSLQFSCMTTLQREVYSKRVEAKIEEKYSEGQRVYFKYHVSEIAGIQEVISIFTEIKTCCVAYRNDSVLRPGGCDGCSDEVAGQLFQLQGFEKIDLNISTAAFANINTAMVKDYSFHKVTVGGQTDYLGEIIENQVQEFNEWFSFNLLVTSNPSLCIDSISGGNLDAFKYMEDFNCQINFPSGEGLKPSDIKITWNRKGGSWIKDANTANLIISLLRCKINRFLGVSSDDCFNVLSIPSWTANMTDMPEFDFFYADYVQSLNVGVSIFDLVEGYKDFGGSETAESPVPEIQNGIEIIYIDAAYGGVPSGAVLIAESPPRGNTEDMTNGVNGNCEGIIEDCFVEYTDQDLFNKMINLFHYFSMFELETIGDAFVTRFQSRNASDYYNISLSSHVAQSPEIKNYVKAIGFELNKILFQNGGLISIGAPINMGNVHPVFNSLYNKFRGLTILINDTEQSQFKYVKDYYFDETTGDWGGEFYIEVTDHFGLDKHDAIVYQGHHSGFAAWWVLQHKRNYPPFRTKIKITARIKGNIGHP
ncbi:MAG: DUF3289 family protein [Saprospiraceae bacterium]